MDTFAQPTGDDREFAKDGTPIARMHPDPVTLGKWTQPHLPDGTLGDPVPTMLAPTDLDAERVETELTHVPATNLDATDRPHFLRNVDGRELCGQDGSDWPCDAYQEMVAEDRRKAGVQEPVPLDGLVRVDDVAAALGITPHELADRMGFANPESAPSSLPDTGR